MNDDIYDRLIEQDDPTNTNADPQNNNKNILLFDDEDNEQNNEKRKERINQRNGREGNQDLHLETYGSVMKKFDRETIMPAKKIEKKKEVMLDRDTSSEAAGKSCWSCLCCCFKGKKVHMNLIFR